MFGSQTKQASTPTRIYLYVSSIAASQNALLVSAALGPFSNYAAVIAKPPGDTNDEQQWRDVVLGWLWGLVLVVNTISLAVTVLCQVRAKQHLCWANMGQG